MASGLLMVLGIGDDRIYLLRVIGLLIDIRPQGRLALTQGSSP